MDTLLLASTTSKEALANIANVLVLMPESALKLLFMSYVAEFDSITALRHIQGRLLQEI